MMLADTCATVRLSAVSLPGTMLSPEGIEIAAATDRADGQRTYCFSARNSQVQPCTARV